MSEIDTALAFTLGSLIDDIPLQIISGVIINGTLGIDLLTGASGDDTVDALAGDDYAEGNGGNDSLNGGEDDDLLKGSIGNDTLTGGNGNDNLYGENGSDYLDGGNGFDNLYGGLENDTLTGGADIDQFVFNASEGADTITDFTSGVDKIVLNTDSFTALVGASEVFAIVNTDEAVATSSALIVYNSANGNLFYQGSQFVHLSSVPAITSTDFVIQSLTAGVG